MVKKRKFRIILGLFLGSIGLLFLLALPFLGRGGETDGLVLLYPFVGFVLGYVVGGLVDILNHILK